MAAAAGPSPSWPPRRVARAFFLALLLFLTERLATHTWASIPLDLVNLAFHEAGHVFLRPFGHTLHFLGGTLFQLGVPALLVWYFPYRRASAFAAAACLWWVGESLVNVAVYMGDARDLALPLVGGGEHDWNELFYRFGVLGEEPVAAISSATHAAGVVVMLLGVAWAALFVVPPAVRGDLVLRLAGVAPRAVRLLAD